MSSSGGLPNPGFELASAALAGRFFTPGKPSLFFFFFLNKVFKMCHVFKACLLEFLFMVLMYFVLHALAHILSSLGKYGFTPASLKEKSD